MYVACKLVIDVQVQSFWEGLLESVTFASCFEVADVWLLPLLSIISTLLIMDFFPWNVYLQGISRPPCTQNSWFWPTKKYIACCWNYFGCVAYDTVNFKHSHGKWAVYIVAFSFAHKFFTYPALPGFFIYMVASNIRF